LKGAGCCLFVVASHNNGAAAGGRIRVLIADRVDDFLIEELKKLGTEVLYSPGISREGLLSIIGEADVLVVRSRTRVDAELIERGTRLRAVARAGVGTDNIDVEAARKRGIAVISAPSAPAASVAELTLALMFALARNLKRAFRSAEDGKWEKIEGVELRGKTAGILGFGRIGREVARLCSCMGMRVIAYDPRREAFSGSAYIEEAGSLEDLLRAADFLTIHVPLTEETRKLIGRRELSIMKDGAYLINTSRGAVIDQEALIEALRTGKLAGAALDVLENEPPGEREKELLSLPNVIATPHIGSQTAEAQRRIAAEIAEKIWQLFGGGS